jgi:hypothetical protein
MSVCRRVQRPGAADTEIARAARGWKGILFVHGVVAQDTGGFRPQFAWLCCPAHSATHLLSRPRWPPARCLRRLGRPLVSALARSATVVTSGGQRRCWRCPLANGRIGQAGRWTRRAAGTWYATRRRTWAWECRHSSRAVRPPKWPGSLMCPVARGSLWNR